MVCKLYKPLYLSSKKSHWLISYTCNLNIIIVLIIHWGLNKMATISKTPFGNIFYWRKMFLYWFNFFLKFVSNGPIVSSSAIIQVTCFILFNSFCTKCRVYKCNYRSVFCYHTISMPAIPNCQQKPLSLWWMLDLYVVGLSSPLIFHFGILFTIVSVIKLIWYHQSGNWWRTFISSSCLKYGYNMLASYGLQTV